MIDTVTRNELIKSLKVQMADRLIEMVNHNDEVDDEKESFNDKDFIDEIFASAVEIEHVEEALDKFGGN